MTKQFLEDYSLYRRLKIEVPELTNLIPQPPINMSCNNCNSIQTFTSNNLAKSFSAGKKVVHTNSQDKCFTFSYTCQSCRKFNRRFHIYISPKLDYIYKFGQYPEWEIKMDKNLEITLAEHSKTFRKGLVCESQGYGIGAFAYYRRITEDIIDELLESITDLIEVDNRQLYIAALEETKKTRVTQDKINLVKDLLPLTLKPDGYNPLGVLHSELSKGLHSKSDAECLENASNVRSILTFLINRIIQSRESNKQFTSSMKSILEKKSKKISKEEE